MGKARRPHPSLPPPTPPPQPSDTEVGFAKLQGEDFEYYMQTYSITLGRNSKKSVESSAGGGAAAFGESGSGGGGVDVDLGSLGGGMNISRRHARIFYDFARRRFALEVLGKNGCIVEGVLHVPGSPPVKLDSQDLLQMGDKKFYFLLPSRSVFDIAVPQLPAVYRGLSRPGEEEEDEEEDEDEEEGEGDEEEEEEVPSTMGGKRLRPGPAGRLVKKPEARVEVGREADDRKLQQLEEKEVITAVANVLSASCGPGEWMPMAKLHEVLYRQFSNLWHHSRVRKYLTSEEFSESETQGRPWFGLLMLLRKFPEHFVIHTKMKSRATVEFISLVSLVS